MNRLRISQNDVRYIGEGNASVVLSLKGTNKILRLKKISASESIISKETELSSLLLQRDYVRFIIEPCFGVNGPIDVPEIIDVDKDDIAALSVGILNERPYSRRHKSISCYWALLAPNYTMPFTESNKSHSTLCVELKCKQGWIPDNLVSLDKCTFCLMQYLKLSHKKIAHVSKYCPLDLFSGDYDRMSKAIHALFETPQNNLKIFLNGKLVYADGLNLNSIIDILKKYLSVFIECENYIQLLADYLIKILKNNMTASSDGVKDMTMTSTNKLPQGCVLERILGLQKVGSNVDIDLNNIQNDFDYVKDMISQNPLKICGDKPATVHFSQPIAVLKETLNSLQKYFVAATFFDCSIMIALKPFEDDSNSDCRMLSIGDTKFAYHVGVADLDAKPASKINYHKLTRANMIDAYLKFVSTPVQLNVCFYGEQSAQGLLRTIISPSLYINTISRIQPHAETKAKQLSAWRSLILNYHKATKQTILDVTESQGSPLFNNTSINRQLSPEDIVYILENLSQKGNAAAINKSKTKWEIYWHSLAEWGNIVYTWVSNNGMNNSVCTLFELTDGENTVDEEFHGLDVNVLVKALEILQLEKKCELINFDDNQGVKFF